MNPIYLKSYIERAIIDNSYLKIDYVDRKFKITKDRIIQPSKMKQNRVVAQCYLRNDLRTFELEGIQKIAIASAEDIKKFMLEKEGGDKNESNK